jgi:hypothetical protein
MVVSSIALCASEARASDKFDSTLDVSLGALSTVTDAGVGLGGAARGGFTLDGFRVGAGLGIARFGSIPNGVSLDGEWRAGPDPAWCLPLEIYAGITIGRARALRPYFELRVTDTYFWSTTSAWLFGVSGRAGFRVPLSEYFFADLGGGVGFTGPERASLVLSLGLPIPLANL